MFGRKVLTLDLAKERDVDRLFITMGHRWVVCDAEQLAPPTKRHKRYRFTFRRPRLGEKWFKPSKLGGSFYSFWKIPTDGSGGDK